MQEIVPGQRIGSFVVVRKLGHGGMGEVFVVRDEALQVDRALKIILKKERSATTGERAGIEREYRERFVREARTLARLRHPHIVPVHAIGEHDGQPFIVMELIEAKDARSWLIEDRPSLARVKETALQVASALAYAHEQNVLHRDIKMSNILVRELEGGSGEVAQQGEGRPSLSLEAMLIDFGLAKSPTDEDLTRTGRSMGTVSYMAPEYLDACLRGERGQHTVQTDLWALGCVLYALTCQRACFPSGGVEIELVQKIRKADFVPVDRIRQNASPSWVALVHDLLRRDPRARIQSAREVVQRIRAIEQVTVPGVPDFFDEEGGDETKEDGGRKTPAASSSASSSTRVRVAPAASEPDDDSGVSSVFASAKRQPADGVDGARSDVALVEEQHPPQAVEKPPQPLALSSFEHLLAEAVKKEETVSRGAPDGVRAVEQLVGGEPVSAVGADQDSASLPTYEVPRSALRATGDGRRALLRRLLVPVCGASAVLVFAGVCIAMTSGAHAKDNGRDVVVSEARERSRAAEELVELQRERKARERAAAVQPKLEPVFHDAAAERQRPSGQAGQAAGADAGPFDMRAFDDGDIGPLQDLTGFVGAGNGVVGVERGAVSTRRANPNDPFALRYGTRPSFNVRSMEREPDAAAAAPAADAAERGVKVPVRVSDAITSSPTGPVIAVVTQETKLGALVLPVGTEVHGTTAGTSGSRVLVSFRFALVGGKSVPLQGIALGLDGRAGVAGTRSLGGVSDVAAGGAAGAVSGAVDALAGAVGQGALSNVVRGAGNPGTAKMGKIDNEEEVVTTRRGERFVVYVGGG